MTVYVVQGGPLYNWPIYGVFSSEYAAKTEAARSRETRSGGCERIGTEGDEVTAADRYASCARYFGEFANG